MIEHIVLFRWSETAKLSDVEGVMKKMGDLKQQIPGIVDLTRGKNFADALGAPTQGYTHSAIVRFVDRAALEAYLPHPAHQNILDMCRPLLDSIIQIDLEA